MVYIRCINDVASLDPGQILSKDKQYDILGTRFKSHHLNWKQGEMLTNQFKWID